MFGEGGVDFLRAGAQLPIGAASFAESRKAILVEHMRFDGYSCENHRGNGQFSDSW